MDLLQRSQICGGVLEDLQLLPLLPLEITI